MKCIIFLFLILISTASGLVVNATQWGYDDQDATECLQAAIDSGATRVIVPYMNTPWIVRPITFISNQEIIFDPGVIVIAKEGSFRSAVACLFTAKNKQNVIIKGYGATFIMQQTD